MTARIEKAHSPGECSLKVDIPTETFEDPKTFLQVRHWQTSNAT